jgi:transglutaminase-like putative cysteine protease
MIFEVSHKTVYRYNAPVAQSHHLVHLVPRPHPRQRVIRHSLEVSPAPALRSDFTDSFGNPASALSIENAHSELTIHSRGLLEVSAPPPVDLAASPPWEAVAARFSPARGPFELDVVAFLPASQHTVPCRALLDFARPSFGSGRPLLDCAMELSRRIHRDFLYDNAATDVVTTIGEVLEIRRGVCQDFAHLFLAAMRVMGCPARYVSGYLLTRPPAGREKLVGADASHAWVSVWTPDPGWVDFDPTNDLLPGAEHITIAYGRDFADVSPVTGVLLGGGAHAVEVSVDVAPTLTVHPLS